jgi:aspartyl-tRNA(Asn)/glutamyl-tRNA(Gln) amidotransferase subunit A
LTPDSQLAFASISEIAKLFRKRKLSPVELTRFMLDRIAKLNTSLNAYLTVSGEIALQQAKRAETELCKSNTKSRHDRGPLHGIPISLKDNIYTKDIRTTGGSKILRDFVPLHDAPVVAALKKVGTVILGKTNMHEFAYGVTTDNPYFGPTHNPWDLQRIPGGSSGGSAAALAAGLCYGSIGTDTGGSIRIPASLCGVVGLKPGLGRVSAEDVIPLSPTLDFVGPMARTVQDASLLLDAVLMNRESSTGSPANRKVAARARRTRLGIPKEFFLDVVEPEVQAAFQRALRLLEKHGARLDEISLPQLPETEKAGNIIAWAEATFYHQQAGWFPSHSGEYGEDILKRLEMGSQVSAVDYLRALEFREKFKETFEEGLVANKVDALVVPTTPITAPLIGEDSTIVNSATYPTRALLLRLCRPANLIGVPAISVPCGLSPCGLPIGLQFIAWKDGNLLLEIAGDLERLVPISSRPRMAE